MGEYGYNRTYQLVDKNNNTLKARTFRYQADLDRLMTETVYDFTANPTQVYTRTQNFKESPSKVGYVLENIVGEAFTTRDASAEDKANYHAKASFSQVSTANLSNLNDTGCSCSFYRDNGNSSAESVFVSDMEGNGGVSIDGKTIEMGGERTDDIAALQQLATSKDWIVLRAKGDITVLGEVVDIRKNNNWYNDTRNHLIDVLSIMETLPSSIPIRKIGQIGMGTSAEFKSMGEEAIQIAKIARDKGESRIPAEFTFSGGRYECYINVNEVGRNDGGGRLYKGTMYLFNQYGLLVGETAIQGDCGC